MMYRYVMRLDIDAADHENEGRALIDDSARRVYATAHIDPSAKYGERAVIIKLCEKILDKLAAEQKQNTGKRGEWIPLGHRMGVCKHPYSEDFKCSLCGYEAYTLFFDPPETCPNCGARMEQ